MNLATRDPLPWFPKKTARPAAAGKRNQQILPSRSLQLDGLASIVWTPALEMLTFSQPVRFNGPVFDGKFMPIHGPCVLTGNTLRLAMATCLGLRGRFLQS